MAHLTLIARASDGLPLSASIVNEESGKDYAEYQPKAKQIFRKLSSVSPTRCSIECEPGPMIFHYILEEGICYLALCETTYPAKLAFSYLENLHKDFSEQHGADVHKASRPYHFIEFGAEINRIKRNYQESQTRRNSHLRSLGDELQGVQKIMFDNIDAALQRGELVSDLSDKAGKLVDHSRAYKKQARYLNLRQSLAAKIAIGVVVFLLLIFLRYLIF